MKIFTPTVAYLGPEASFTHVAATTLFGSSGLIPQPTIPDCIEAVAEGHVAYAIVPLENALEGSVPMTIDYLFHESELFINAEISIPIEQHLMVNKKQAAHLSMILNPSIPIHMHLHNVINIYSTITVASRSFRRHRRRPLRNIFLKIPDEKIAAIGNRMAAEKYGLHIAEENIHDFHFNHTRFVVIIIAKRNVWKKKAIQKSSKQH